MVFTMGLRHDYLWQCKEAAERLYGCEILRLAYAPYPTLVSALQIKAHSRGLELPKDGSLEVTKTAK